MRVLIAFGSKRGGTEGLALRVAATLTQHGHEVEVRPGHAVDGLGGHDAVIVGGALYAGLWHRSARRFVRRHVDELRLVPVWAFSSGPLDASAGEGEIPPTKAVARLLRAVGARGHVTFGGRLETYAKGFIARAMVRSGHSGDFRDMDAVDAWAHGLAEELAMLPARAARPATRLDRPLRGVLVGLAWFTGVTAVVGGMGLMLAPQGSPSLPPPSMLEHTPFSSFFVPGLLLAGVVGLGNLVAGTLALRRHRWRELAAGAGGLTLIGWIVIQMLLIRSFHWLHALYLAVGLATAGVAAWAYARHRAVLRERAPDRRPPDDASGSAWPEPAGLAAARSR